MNGWMDRQRDKLLMNFFPLDPKGAKAGILETSTKKEHEFSTL